MDEVQEYEDIPNDLVPCGSCGRTFLPDTLARHAKICKKNTTKKRKVFDSRKMRIQGTDLASVPKQPVKELPPSKKNNWRQKHEELVDAMRAARGVSIAMKTGAPLPPPPAQKRVNPDYVQCPSCERHFSENAAERHIPWCKEKNKRIDKRQPSATDKSKLNTRTKYKPPLPGSKKKQPSPVKAPGTRASPSTRSARSPMDSDVADITTRMNGSVRLGNRTNVRNKPYTGSKARSASLERPSAKTSSNSYRSNSGDAIKGRGTREDVPYSNRGYREHAPSQYSDEEDDLDSPDTRRGSAGRRLQPLTAKQTSNQYLPHDRLRVVSDESDFVTSTSRTPTPPSSRPASNSRKTSADVVNGRRLPKFCHECGTRYPVANAKFCCECGMRRAYLD